MRKKFTQEMIDATVRAWKEFHAVVRNQHTQGERYEADVMLNRTLAERDRDTASSFARPLHLVHELSDAFVIEVGQAVEREFEVKLQSHPLDINALWDECTAIIDADLHKPIEERVPASEYLRHMLNIAEAIHDKVCAPMAGTGRAVGDTMPGNDIVPGVVPDDWTKDFDPRTN